MVIIELYKPRATHMKYIEGKWGVFYIENDEVILFYKIFQIYFPILNFQTCNCILGGDILYACAKFQSKLISLKTF